MNIKLSFNDKNFSAREAVVFAVYTKNIEQKGQGKEKEKEREKDKNKKKTELLFPHWPKDLIQALS